MKDILKRLASPVVITQIIVTIVGTLIFFLPEQTETIKIISGSLIALVNLFAGINDPTNKNGF